MDLNNFQDVESALAKYIPASRHITGKDITLVRMKPLMAHLGNPERKLKIIHVAGTSGKTSTCYYLASLLQATNKKVGLTVSPHVSCINERIQINLEPLSEKDFCTALEEFLELIKNVTPEPTYFELLIAFVYWYFAKAGVDYAVMETGLGGLHDATNLATQADKVCVITDIGFDHMHVLGKKLTSIAKQKAGIMHPGNQVFMYEQSREINDVFKQRAQEQSATLNMLSELEENKEQASNSALNSLPLFQQRNWLLANHVYEYVANRDGLPALASNQQNLTMAVQVPGRMDVRSVEGKILILDGAHNEQKMRAFVSSFQKLYPGKKAAILLGLKEGKEYESVLPLLKPICIQLVVTSFATTQDLPIKAIKPSILAEAAQRLKFSNVVVEPNAQKALDLLMNSTADSVVVTGSFYLLGNLMGSSFLLASN